MYNKLEALREKGDAEKMIASKDYMGAREKILKAQQLFPALDHIIAMLTVCDILSAARNRIPGYDTDYYWVLQLMPSSSPADVKRQYEKLFVLLQPIKGKFSGTELALKLIEEAFSVLSDRSTRLMFDSKRGTCWDDYESFSSGQIPSVYDKVSSGQFWDRNNVKGLSMHVQQERNDDLGDKPQANHDLKNHNANISPQGSSSVTSDKNSEGNTGEDIDSPVDDLNLSGELPITGMESTLSWSAKPVVHKKLDQDFFNFGDNRSVECFKIGQIWAVHNYDLEEAQNYRYAQINSISKSAIGISWLKPVPVSRCERRWCDAGLPVACGSFCLDFDMNEKVSKPTAFSYNCLWVPGVAEEQFEIYPRKGEVWALYEDFNLDEWSYNPEKIKGCRFKFVEILSDFSKYVGAEGACLSKVDGFNSIFTRETKEGNPLILHMYPSDLYMLSHNVPAYKFTGGEIDGVVGGMFELDQLALLGNKQQDVDGLMMTKEEKIENSDFTNPVGPLTPPNLKLESTVLGPRRMMNDFAAGQVWAVYYGKYLMPRKYARIVSVISGSEVCVTFLNPQPYTEYEVPRKKESLPLVCGMFEAKELTVNLNISQLSHLVKCQMNIIRPIYKIYPMKGEVWAMYQNWNKEWRQRDYDNYKCWIVEILSDFYEEERMMVARLVEVKGCLTFFQRMQRDGFDMARAVSKPEMFSFAHQIPAFRVPGIGRYGIPENSWHLEPNALPPQHQK